VIFLEFQVHYTERKRKKEEKSSVLSEKTEVLSAYRDMESPEPDHKRLL